MCIDLTRADTVFQHRPIPGREPTRQVVRLGQTARMHHLTVDDDARRRSDAVTGDRRVIGHLLRYPIQCQSARAIGAHIDGLETEFLRLSFKLCREDLRPAARNGPHCSRHVVMALCRQTDRRHAAHLRRTPPLGRLPCRRREQLAGMRRGSRTNQRKRVE